MPPHPIYLDNHATTALDQRVLDKMLYWLSEGIGNAHSQEHLIGQKAADAVAQARTQVADLVATEPERIIFTSGATESINIAIQGFCNAKAVSSSKARIALAPTEHSAVLETCLAMQKRGSADLYWLDVDTLGQVSLDEIETTCRNGIDLLCVMGANNEIGTIYPIDLIGSIASKYNVAFFCDGSQIVGRVPISCEKSGISFLSISAHKMYGPKGVGALAIREKSLLRPISFGGEHELGIRPGTLNVPGIIGFGSACVFRKAEMQADESEIAKRRDRLQHILCSGISETIVNGDPINRLAGNLNFAVKGIPNDAVLARMRDRVAISTGAACASGVAAPSHVLRAIKLNEDWIGGAFRICVGKFNTNDEIEAAGIEICSAVNAVRNLM